MPQDPPVLVTFARPEESRAFRRRLLDRQNTRSSAGIRLVKGTIAAQTIVVAYTGIGPTAATQSIRQFLKLGPWRHVIAAGFAGGLHPSLRLGDIVSQDFPAAHPALVSRPLPVERVADKTALHLETGAGAVDMETAFIATACSEAGLRLTAIRAISDPANCDLPVPFATWFDIERQRPKPFALLSFLLRHPSRISPFFRFVRGLPAVREALAAAVESKIREA